MVKAKKSTKKFQKNQLKTQLENRKKFKKVKKQFKKEKPVKEEKEVDEEVFDQEEFSAEDSGSEMEVFEQQDDGEFGGLDMEKLKETDPEFYQFLKENDEKLLDFRMDDVPNAVEEEVMEEVIDDEDAKYSDFEEEEINDEQKEENISEKDLAELKAGLKANNLDSVEKCLKMLQNSVFTEKQEKEDLMPLVRNEETFEELLQMFLQDIPAILMPLLQKKGNNRLMTILKSHLMTLVNILTRLTQPNLFIVILDSLECEEWAPLIAKFSPQHQKFLRQLIQFLISHWTQSGFLVENSEEDEDDETLKQEIKKKNDEKKKLALVCLEWLMELTKQQSLSQYILKQAHQTYLNVFDKMQSRFYDSLMLVQLQLSNLIQMSSTKVAYPLGFQSLRSICLQLRQQMTEQSSKEKTKNQVLKWQTLGTLQLWLLVVLPKEGSDSVFYQQMKFFHFPLIQVSMAVLKWALRPSYAPFCYHLCHCLSHFSKKTKITVPLSGFYFYYLKKSLEHFQTQKKFKQPQKKLAVQLLDWNGLIHFTPQQQQQPQHEHQIYQYFINGITEHLSSYANWVSFPEYNFSVMLQLKKFQQQLKTVPFSEQQKEPLCQLIAVLNENEKYIKQKREKLLTVWQQEQWDLLEDQHMPWEQTPLGQFMLRKLKQEQKRKMLMGK